MSPEEIKSRNPDSCKRKIRTNIETEQEEQPHKQQQGKKKKTTQHNGLKIFFKKSQTND